MNIFLDIIEIIIPIIAIIGAFIIGRKVPANKINNAQSILAIATDWANKFVRYARQFLALDPGEERMAFVVKQLKKIAEANGWEVTEEQLTAIAQEAYDKMKNEEN